MRLHSLLALAAVLAAHSQTLQDLTPQNGHADSVTYRQRPAIHVTPADNSNNGALALLKGSSFQDGTIEADVAGAPGPGADTAARGFIGLAFRVQAQKLELFYLRPTNGRADDQLRRNHSTQYESFPDWPWSRLRQESPGVYESYVDLETGAWTHVRIVVSGAKAKLYVNRAAQPCLIVNDLKLTPAKGAVALWSGPGTDGYFANLRVIPQ